MPGTPSGKSFVYDVPRAGGGGFGGGQTDPFGYALSEEALGYKRAEEKRTQKEFEINQSREQRRADYQQRKIDQQDQLENALFKISDKLGTPASFKAQDKYEDLMGDPDIHEARMTREGRIAIDSALKEWHDNHQDYVKGWQDWVGNYGFNAPISSLSDDYFDSKGRPVWNKLKPVLDQSLARKQQMEAIQIQMAQKQAESAGYQMIAMPGQRPKFLKKEQQFGVPTGKAPTTEPSKPAQLPSLSDFARQYQSIQQQQMTQPVEGVDSLGQ